MKRPRRIQATAVDLFCGAGGLTRGLREAGLAVAAGYDIDAACRYPYEFNNPGARFHNRSVTALTGRELRRHYPDGHVRILVGCAPCQMFSKYAQGLRNGDDPKWTLLKDFARLVEEVKPEIVSIENVPELQRYSIFREFLAVLVNEGFHFPADRTKQIVECSDYGVPQHRRRLVLVASKLGPIQLIPATHHREHHKNVRDVLRDLPPIRAGEVSAIDPLHRSSRLSERNLERIRASKPGGSWRDWPARLRAKCHKQTTGKSYPSVYGRMEWDKPSQTITTQFYGFGSGRFGHPRQDRGLSLREGALLQSFPKRYEFVEPDSGYRIKELGRMIGNAVPVRLGRAIGRSITRHLVEHGR